MKTGNTPEFVMAFRWNLDASMEPGHEDREYAGMRRTVAVSDTPQWSPVMKTGNTDKEAVAAAKTARPQWSPVMKTGNTLTSAAADTAYEWPQWSPVMKTGNTYRAGCRTCPRYRPQWSPVMKTGNTCRGTPLMTSTQLASMEPGHEDREYAVYKPRLVCTSSPQWSPVMKTGNTSRVLHLF